MRPAGEQVVSRWWAQDERAAWRTSRAGTRISVRAVALRVSGRQVPQCDAVLAVADNRHLSEIYAECHGDLVGVLACLDEWVLRLHPSGAEPPPWKR